MLSDVPDSRSGDEGGSKRRRPLIDAGEATATRNVGGRGKVPSSAKRMSLSFLCATGLLESMHSGGCAAWWAVG